MTYTASSAFDTLEPGTPATPVAWGDIPPIPDTMGCVPSDFVIDMSHYAKNMNPKTGRNTESTGNP